MRSWQWGLIEPYICTEITQEVSYVSQGVQKGPVEKYTHCLRCCDALSLMVVVVTIGFLQNSRISLRLRWAATLAALALSEVFPIRRRGRVVILERGTDLDTRLHRVGSSLGCADKGSNV